MASPLTNSGAKKLSEAARHLVAPKGIASTEWPSVRDTCRLKLGIEFDEWQHGAGRLILAKRRDGKLASTIGGIGMSLPRQVGKTYLIGAMSFALCINRPGLLVIWSAHHARTHGETFLAMQSFAKRAKVAPWVDKVYVGSGDEEIRFHNGSRILFGARERGFGRGIPGVDVLIFDEGQILSERAMENMLATMNTSRFGLHMYVGTPPRSEDPSETFTRMRTEAYSGEAADMAWIEFGASPGVSPDDRKQWAVANPSFPHRTPVESILRLKKKLTPEAFMREGLGVWDDPDSTGDFFTPGKWSEGADPESTIVGAPVLSIAVSVDRSRATIAAAGLSPSGKLHLEPVKIDTGLGWVIEDAIRLQEFHKPLAFVMDGGGPGADLVEPLQDAGVNLTVMDLNDVKEACSLIFDSVENGGHAHLNDPDLNAAVKGAKKRDIGDRFAIGRRKSTSDVTPFEAVTFAAWGVSQLANYDPLESVL